MPVGTGNTKLKKAATALGNLAEGNAKWVEAPETKSWDWIKEVEENACPDSKHQPGAGRPLGEGVWALLCWARLYSRRMEYVDYSK